MVATPEETIRSNTNLQPALLALGVLSALHSSATGQYRRARRLSLNRKHSRPTPAPRVNSTVPIRFASERVAAMWKLAIILCFIAPCVLRAQEKGFQTPVLVSFPEGTTVTDLASQELLTELDGHEVDHGTPVSLPTVPLRVGLVFDESGSARRSASLSMLHLSVLDWVAASLAQHGGDAFLVGFNDQIIISTETTTDISELRRALSQLRPIGGSAIRDAIVHSTQKFYSLGMESKLTARILVLVSDGFDNASHAKDRDALQSAQRSGVRIYAIGFSSPEVEAGGNVLVQLCQHTGGMSFFPGNNESEIGRALTTIDRDLAHSFLVGLSPLIRDAKLHHLSLKFPKMPNTALRYMSGFYSLYTR